MDTLDITSSSFKADPFPIYEELRQVAPVHPVMLRGRRRAWLVTRYDDVLRVLKEQDLFVKDRSRAMSAEQLARAPRIPRAFAALERNLLSVDGAEHRRLRELVHGAFTTAMIERMRTTTEEVASEAAVRLVGMTEFDLVADYALRVPLVVIGRMLGMPDRDHARFALWWRSFLAIGSRPYAIWHLLRMLRLLALLRRLIAEAHDNASDSVIASLVAARDDRGRLSDDEILALLMLLMSAGHETTVGLIGMSLLELVSRPEQLEMVRRGTTSMSTAVEELLRFTSPAETATERYAMADVSLGGTIIPKGELVLAVLASANRDQDKFANADELDVTRSPNRHLAFGSGSHHCLGASLARMEASVALRVLLDVPRTLVLRQPRSKLRWREGLILRGVVALPARFL